MGLSGKRLYILLDASCLSVSLFSGSYQVTTHSHCHHVVDWHTEPSNSELSPLKLGAEINPSSFELLMSSICHREKRKLMNSALLGREMSVDT